MNSRPVDPDELVLVTREGYEALHAELATLRGLRPELVERLREARDDGDLAANPALYEVLEEQAQLELSIAQLEVRLATARIAEPVPGGRAGIGSSVRLRDGETNEVVEYALVGSIEANVGDGRVSVDAPVGRALVGAGAGEVVEAETPRGRVRLEILDVRASPARRAA